MEEEIWKDIKDYKHLYKISNFGRVYSCMTVRFLQPGVSRIGNYKKVVLYKNGKGITKKIHRLIAEAFIPNPENKPCIDHIDGDRLNNSISNLRWATYKENTNNPITLAKMKKTKSKKRRNPLSWFKKVCKPVICIEANMLFSSINEAGRYLNIDARKICQVCKGNKETIGGYHWKYAEPEAC